MGREDEDRRRLTLQYHALNVRWNSPISRVPEEILAEIFLFYAEDVGDALKMGESSAPNGHDSSHGLGQGSRKGCHWLWITQFCRRWQMVALSYPRLWRNICVGPNPLWVAELLRRSGRVPLRVCAVLSDDETGHKRLDTLRTIVWETGRITALTLDFALTHLGAIQDLLRQLPDDLKALDVALIGVGTPTGADEDHLAIAAKSQNIRVQHIALADVSFVTRVSPLFCPTLTTLSWTSTHHSPQFTTLSHVLDFLEALPLLADITLDNVLPFALVEDHANRMITLQCLKSLKLSGTLVGLPASVCATLLDHLNLPDISTTTLECTSTGVDDSEFVLPFAGLLQQAAEIHTLHVDLDTWGLDLRMWAGEESVGCTPAWSHCTRGNFNLTLSSSSLRLGHQVLLPFFQTAPLSNVRTMAVSLLQLQLGDWREMLACVPQVTVLEISRCLRPAYLHPL
ncbi:hypothetical protein CERSUDRAFT_94879 [Gelatoporia subvermispora B]|uniref:Uncharacterized protein n=1 Tax=Ceriporiopsis subvermispora (strain B) TaxID=914234 RepID=M2RHC2_CERS8|nr:hypothetical protein CERSUDRAFT_94879 [Gelatoporia subvermispora B]